MDDKRDSRFEQKSVRRIINPDTGLIYTDVLGTGAPDGTKVLKGDSTWGPSISGVANIKQTEIDFGATPVAEASFTVIDADVDASSKLIGGVSYEAPTGKALDEVEMDGLDLKFGPGTGQFTLFARGLDGYVADKFKINYLIG